MASSRQFSYSGGCCRSDTNEPQPCPATRCPNGTDAEISPDFANTLYSGQGPPCTRIDPPIVMSGSPLWFGFLRVNRAGKHIGIHISRIVRGVRLLSSLVAALPRWGLAPNKLVICSRPGGARLCSSIVVVQGGVSTGSPSSPHGIPWLPSCRPSDPVALGSGIPWPTEFSGCT